MTKLKAYLNHHKAGLIGTMVSLVILAALLTFGIWRYGWGWTGFLAYTTTTTTPAGTSIQTQPGKTLWDWLELLIIPLVLTAGGYWLNRAQRRREQQLAQDQEQAQALQGYLEAMTELIVKHNLTEQEVYAAESIIARSRTLTLLPGLNGLRKASVLRFLYESRLISQEKPVINLNMADFSGADLGEARLGDANLEQVNLTKANLKGANLAGANLLGADLSQANLHKAVLSGARLFEANLRGTNLREASLQPLIQIDAVPVSPPGADLSQANLSGADLRGANLQEVNLSGTDLSQADLSNINLLGAKYDEATKWPPDFDPGRAGAVK